PTRETLTVGALALVLWPLVLRSVGLYRPQRHKSALDEVFGVFKATVLAGLLLVAITYFAREDRYSRGALLIFTALAFVGVGALPSRSFHRLPRIMEICADTTVDVKLVPDVYQYATLFGGLEEFGGLPIVNLQSVGVLGINALAKRAFDVILSALFLALLAPLMLLVAALVKIGSPGPVLYRQER